MEAFISFMKGLDYSPLIISFKTGIVTTIICFFLGLYAAARAIKARPFLRTVLDGLLTLPMVIPPTAVGFFLLIIFSRRRPVGFFLYDKFGISVVQTYLGCVLAAFVIAFPIMYRNARAAIEQVDSNLVFAGRTLGLSETEIFWKIIFPNAFPGIMSGTVLCFARALGEYGATSMLAGNIAGKTGTLSQKIAMVIQNGDYMTAGFWTVVVLICAFLIIWVMNIITIKNAKIKRKW